VASLWGNYGEVWQCGVAATASPMLGFASKS